MAKSQRLSNLPNAPAFNAYAAATTSLTSGAYTKVLFNTEVYDTASCFASSRFTPNVAGYYLITAAVQLNATSVPDAAINIHKNGTAHRIGDYTETALTYPIKTVSEIIYLNGSTDYVEIFAFHSKGTTVDTSTGESQVRFSGCLVRPAA